MTPEEVEEELARLHPEAFGWASSCCRFDGASAEDVLQTAYVRVLEGRARFGGRSAFRTWLFGVIRRVAQEEGRRRRRRRARTLPLEASPRRLRAVETDPGETVDRAETARRLRAALARLPDRQREVLHLVFYQGMTVAGAAEVMDVSVGTARTHYHRGKLRMRELLERMDTREGETT